MDVLALDPVQAGASAAPATPAASPEPAANAAASPKKPDPADQTLHRALAQLVGGGSNVAVSYRVVEHPNEIVTVFTNLETGRVINEFPSETMVLIAQFFDKLAGAVLDRTA